MRLGDVSRVFPPESTVLAAPKSEVMHNTNEGETQRLLPRPTESHWNKNNDEGKESTPTSEIDRMCTMNITSSHQSIRFMPSLLGLPLTLFSRQPQKQTPWAELVHEDGCLLPNPKRVILQNQLYVHLIMHQYEAPRSHSSL